ncbi:hypothetical protein ABVT39_013796 [Epinephelus coioides]
MSAAVGPRTAAQRQAGPALQPLFPRNQRPKLLNFDSSLNGAMHADKRAICLQQPSSRARRSAVKHTGEQIKAL